LLARGEVGDEFVREHGELFGPIPVLGPDGALNSWLVSITVGDRLVAWLQLLPDLELLRYSTFMRHPRAIDDCPEKDDWLNVETIKRRARSYAQSEERLGEPWMTYDGNPSRVVWVLEATRADGRSRALMVAGENVFEARNGGSVAIGGCSNHD